MKPRKEDVNIIYGRNIDGHSAGPCVPLFLFSPHLTSSVIYLDTQKHGPDLEVSRWRGGGGQCYVVASHNLVLLFVNIGPPTSSIGLQTSVLKKKLFKLGIFSVSNKI